MPPAATVSGEFDEPAAISTGRLWAPPALVTSCATADAELTSVATREGPGATVWTVLKAVEKAFGTPTLT